jgi:hypothetical protein
MQKLESAGFVSGIGLYLMLASFQLGGPLHLQIFMLPVVKLARQHREREVAGTIAAIRYCEEALPNQGVRATYYVFPARARWGKDDRSVAQLAEYLLGGTQDVWTCPGRHSAIRCHATGQSHPGHSSFLLRQRQGLGGR